MKNKGLNYLFKKVYLNKKNICLYILGIVMAFHNYHGYVLEAAKSINKNDLFSLWLIQNHYSTLVIYLILFVVNFQLIKLIIQNENNLIVRLKQEGYNQFLISYSIINIILNIVLMYLPFIFLIFKDQYNILTVLHLIIFLIIFLINQLIILFVIKHKKYKPLLIVCILIAMLVQFVLFSQYIGKIIFMKGAL